MLIRWSYCRYCAVLGLEECAALLGEPVLAAEALNNPNYVSCTRCTFPATAGLQVNTAILLNSPTKFGSATYLLLPGSALLASETCSLSFACHRRSIFCALIFIFYAPIAGRRFTGSLALYPSISFVLHIKQVAYEPLSCRAYNSNTSKSHLRRCDSSSC
jgi:hypothetical protein